MCWWKVSKFAVVALLAGASVAWADDVPEPHVRAQSPLAQRLIADAAQRSPLFKQLVDRLSETDVVVYVDLDMRLPDRTRGRLRFVGMAGGRRYLDVRIARSLDRRAEMASLGHELQHALEIADARDVVDARTLGQLYRRIGYSVSDKSWHESRAALETGQAVFRELRETAAVAADDAEHQSRK